MRYVQRIVIANPASHRQRMRHGARPCGGNENLTVLRVLCIGRTQETGDSLQGFPTDSPERSLDPSRKRHVLLGGTVRGPGRQRDRRAHGAEIPKHCRRGLGSLRSAPFNGVSQDSFGTRDGRRKKIGQGIRHQRPPLAGPQGDAEQHRGPPAGVRSESGYRIRHLQS